MKGYVCVETYNGPEGRVDGWRGKAFRYVLEEDGLGFFWECGKVARMGVCSCMAEDGTAL